MIGNVAILFSDFLSIKPLVKSNTVQVTSSPLMNCSQIIIESCIDANLKAASHWSWDITFVIPIDDPSNAGLTIIGAPNV